MSAGLLFSSQKNVLQLSLSMWDISKDGSMAKGMLTVECHWSSIVSCHGCSSSFLLCMQFVQLWIMGLASCHTALWALPLIKIKTIETEFYSSEFSWFHTHNIYTVLHECRCRWHHHQMTLYVMQYLFCISTNEVWLMIFLLFYYIVFMPMLQTKSNMFSAISYV